METRPQKFDPNYDLEVEMELTDDAAADQMDADPLVGRGAHGPIWETCPSSRPGRPRQLRIPRVPPHASIATTSAVTYVPDDIDEAKFESESEIDDDAEG